MAAMSMRLGFMAAASALALAASASSASAGAFGLRTQSTIALGQAFAGNAAGAAGLSSAFWNPATLTMHPGYTSEYNFSYVVPDIKVNPVASTPTVGFGGSGDIGVDSFVPASFTAYQINDTVWLGVSTAAPFGSNTKPNDFWAGQTYSRSSKILSVNVTPMMGIKLTDWISIGFGPSIQYFDAKLKSASDPTPTAGTVLLKGDDFSAGYTVGVTMTPMAGTTIGVGYRSSIRHVLEGTLSTPANVLPVSLRINLPEQLTVGLTQQITPEFKMSAGFEWMNWSRLGNQAIVSREFGLTVGTVPLNYKDGFIYSVGGEYQVNSAWAVRAGVAFEESPIDVSNRSTRLPDTDRVYASIGTTYRWNEKLSINAAYSRVFAVGSSRIQIDPGNPQFNGLPFAATTDVSVDVFSLGLTYKWDNPRVAAASPLVARY